MTLDEIKDAMEELTEEIRELENRMEDMEW
jgi:cell division septum initiation protein DivIVA